MNDFSILLKMSRANSYSFSFFNLLLIFWLCHPICGVLVPPPRAEPTHPELEAWGLNHWTTREMPGAQNRACFSSCDACEPRLGEASFSLYCH